MSDQVPLSHLNALFFAELLPDTHKAPEAPKPAKGGKKSKYTAEQLEILAAAGIDDPAAADPQTVAAILGQ